ncbi:MAG: DUF488 domain-containing protein [Microbacteriaceae bacterium]|nr:DUF488 domain-containing protein [Microbacteriaceae bacterium]
MEVSIKRVYQPAVDADGFRVLVDRLWPRGISKEHARANIWLKEVGPSNELRKWFNHEPEKWGQFRERYQLELRDNPAFRQLQEIVQEQEKVTLVYSAHDETMNQAVVLREMLVAN